MLPGLFTYPGLTLFPGGESTGGGGGGYVDLDPFDMRVTLAGMTLLEYDDADGVHWNVGSLVGWDSPDVRGDVVARPSGHGSFAPELWFDARKLSLEGSFWAPTRRLQRQAETRLKAATSSLEGVTLRVDEPPYARQATVWRIGRLEVVTTGTFSQYTLPLVAPDPFKYDVLEQSVPIALPSAGSSGVGFPLSFPFGFGGGASDVTIANDGDAIVWPTIRMPGPVADPIVRNNTTGEQLELSISLAAGQWLDVNTRDRTVLLNGTASRRGSVVAGSTWPSLPPGVSTFQYRADAATSSTAVLRYRSGWS